MYKVACWGACVLALLVGCVTTSQYDRGYQAAKAEAGNAQKDFGPAAEPMITARVLVPGHRAEKESAEWRKGYLTGMREEFRSFPEPPGWADEGE